MTEQQFRSIRLPLRSLLKTPDKTLPILLEYVHHTNVIVTYAYQFIRLYLLDCFHKEAKVEPVSAKFCEHVLSTICYPDKKRVENSPLYRLQRFYHEQFKDLLPKQKTFNPKNLSSVIQYISVEMNTCLHNNIKIHFMARLKQILIFLLKKEPSFNDLSHGQIRRGAVLVMNALWDKDKSGLKPSLHGVYDYCLEHFIPKENYLKNLAYDLEANTQRYFLATFQMNLFRERHGLKPFQIICLRKSAVPKNIPIDTKGLIYLFDLTGVSRITTKHELLANYKKNQFLQEALWSSLFKTDLKVFRDKGKYSFFYYIVTDGVGCSLKFINQEYRVYHQKRYQAGKSAEDIALFKRFNNKQAQKQLSVTQKCETPIISELSTKQKQDLLAENLVGCDPGLYNIVQLADAGGGHLKYTRRQRYKETYLVQNNRNKQKMRRSAGINQIEKDLNQCKGRTMDLTEFKHYIETKNQVLLETSHHYQQLSYRKMNLRHFIHVKKSEARLIKNIKRVFGADATILYGNWSRPTQMRYNAPVPGRGIKRLISRHFNVLTVDEFNSSSICFYNQKRLQNNKISGKSLHRCLVCERCRSLKNESEVTRFINRDIMGALNIRMLGVLELQDKERPKAYNRAQYQRVIGVDPFDEPRALPVQTTTKLSFKTPRLKKTIVV